MHKLLFLLITYFVNKEKYKKLDKNEYSQALLALSKRIFTMFLLNNYTFVIDYLLYGFYFFKAKEILRFCIFPFSN